MSRQWWQPWRKKGPGNALEAGKRTATPHDSIRFILIRTQPRELKITSPPVSSLITKRPYCRWEKRRNTASKELNVRATRTIERKNSHRQNYLSLVVVITRSILFCSKTFFRFSAQRCLFYITLLNYVWSILSYFYYYDHPYIIINYHDHKFLYYLTNQFLNFCWCKNLHKVRRTKGNDEYDFKLNFEIAHLTGSDKVSVKRL